MKANIFKLVSVILLFFAVKLYAEIKPNSSIEEKTDVPVVKVTKLDVNDMMLKLTYEIKNNTEQDIWILAGFGKTDVSMEMFMDEDDKTLLFRRRIDVPANSEATGVLSRYILLRKGQNRIESIIDAIPINPEYVLSNVHLIQASDFKYAECLAIEIGYYRKNLPELFRDVFEKVNKIDESNDNSNEKTIRQFFPNPLHFNEWNEELRQRDEEVFLPYTYQRFKGEQVLRTVIEDVNIPYKETDFLMSGHSGRMSLDIPPCKQIDIKFKPSILEFYFPFSGQQNLLDIEEKQYLKSLKKIVVKDAESIKTFINEVNKAVPTEGIVCEINKANVICYHNDGSQTFFSIYNNDSIVTDEFDFFTFFPFDIVPLRILTPQIKPYEQRLQCAANLRNVWHRFRLYNKAEHIQKFESNEIIYPSPTNWCDTVIKIYPSYYDDGESHLCLVCPTSNKSNLANCYYAMNPNCKPDSPGDMVLLFETEAGWNQYGGPELFTFDNHDPKGGCVLLNDGTVKFIRTKEELNNLRWE